MKTVEFMQRQFGNNDNKEKYFSSVYKDGKGNIYSYGHHYPLLFSVGEGYNKLTFRNCAGYSPSTAKHILWAGQADPGAIDVWVSGCNQYSWRNSENVHKVPYILYNSKYYGLNTEEALLKAVFADLEAELVDINKRLAEKKRTNTKVYAALLAERNNCTDRISSVKPYLKGAN